MRSTKGFQFKSFWLPLFLFAAAVILFYKTLDALPSVVSAVGTVVSILSPFIIAVIICLLLYKPTQSLEAFLKKRKQPFFQKHAVGLSVLLSYIAFVLALAAVLYIIIPKIVSSVSSLVTNIPYYYDTALTYLKSVADENGKVFGVELASIKNVLSLENILSFFSMERITGYLSGVTKATGFVLHLSMGFVASIYLLLGKRQLLQTADRLTGLFLPRAKVTRLHNYFSRSCAIFCNYLYSQVLDAVIVAILSFIVFSIARIPYALLLAVLMGICNLIPYFGALISGFFVVLAALISSGSWVKGAVALICVVAIQQLDANFMQPRVVSQSVGLKPIYVLFAITVGNGLFGIPGVLLGVPAFAVLRMLVVDYMQSLKGEATPLVKRQLAAAENSDEKECNLE